MVDGTPATRYCRYWEVPYLRNLAKWLVRMYDVTYPTS